MPAFTMEIPVRFADTDPAGIVFYPRYFEMMNKVVEDWFAHGLGLPFRRMHLEEHVGVPAVSVEAVFENPSRLGDMLTFALTVRRIGTKSATIDIAATCDGEPRLNARQVIAYTTTRPAINAVPIPGDLCDRMAAFVDDGED